jgi:hypothetical protein
MREFKDSVTGKDDDREELPTPAESSEGEARSGPAGGESDTDGSGDASPTTAGQKQA